MALAAFHRKKLQAVRDRITRDKRAVVEAAHNGAAAGYAAAQADMAAELEELRRWKQTSLMRLDENRASIRKLQEQLVATEALRRAECKRGGERFQENCNLTAEVQRLKGEASVLRREAADPRKAAILECIAVVKAERTVSRAVTALRAFLKG